MEYLLKRGQESRKMDKVATGTRKRQVGDKDGKGGSDQNRAPDSSNVATGENGWEYW